MAARPIKFPTRLSLTADFRFEYPEVQRVIESNDKIMAAFQAATGVSEYSLSEVKLLEAELQAAYKRGDKDKVEEIQRRLNPDLEDGGRWGKYNAPDLNLRV